MFNIRQYGEREIELGLSILAKRPDDRVQHDRVCYWALKLGKMELAEQHAKSPKMKAMLESWKS